MLRTFLLCPIALSALLLPNLSMCSEWKMPRQNDKVELWLESREIVRGVLLEVTPENLLVRPYGFLPDEKRIPRSEIIGIRKKGEEVFYTLTGEPLPADYDPHVFHSREDGRTGRLPPTVIRVRVYDKLPFMGIAIAGGVFAGHRYGKASSERELADQLKALGEDGAAQELESEANSHEIEALLGLLIGAAALVYACLPTIEETTLPIVAEHSDGLSSVRVGVDLRRLLSHRSCSNYGTPR